MDNFICDKCKFCFDTKDAYPDIVIATTTVIGYSCYRFCYKCGKQIHTVIDQMLERGAEYDETVI